MSLLSASKRVWNAVKIVGGILAAIAVAVVGILGYKKIKVLLGRWGFLDPQETRRWRPVEGDPTQIEVLDGDAWKRIQLPEVTTDHGTRVQVKAKDVIGAGVSKDDKKTVKLEVLHEKIDLSNLPGSGGNASTNGAGKSDNLDL